MVVPMANTTATATTGVTKNETDGTRGAQTHQMDVRVRVTPLQETELTLVISDDDTVADAEAKMHKLCEEDQLAIGQRSSSFRFVVDDDVRQVHRVFSRPNRRLWDAYLEVAVYLKRTAVLPVLYWMHIEERDLRCSNDDERQQQQQHQHQSLGTIARVQELADVVDGDAHAQIQAQADAYGAMCHVPL